MTFLKLFLSYLFFSAQFGFVLQGQTPGNPLSAGLERSRGPDERVMREAAATSPPGFMVGTEKKFFISLS